MTLLDELSGGLGRWCDGVAAAAGGGLTPSGQVAVSGVGASQVVLLEVSR